MLKLVKFIVVAVLIVWAGGIFLLKIGAIN